MFRTLFKRKGSAVILLFVLLYVLYAYIAPPAAVVIPQDILQRYDAIGAQPESMGRGFGSTLSSPIFASLMALLCAVMIASIVKRGIQIFRSTRNSKLLAAHPLLPHDPIRERLLKRLQLRKYSCQIAEEAGGISLTAQRGQWGGIGSILFHLGLLGIIAGITYSTLGPGTESILLTEGESYELSHGGGNASAPGQPAHTRSTQSPSVVRLVDFDSLSNFDDLREPAALLEARTGGEDQKARLYSNSSLTVDGRKIHLGGSHGYSPYLHITRPDGEVLCSAFVRIAALKDGSHSDFLDIDNGRMRIFLTMHPPSGRPEGSESLRLEFRYRTETGEEGQTLLALGETKKTPGITVTFEDLREWAQFDIAESTAPGIIAFGAVLGLLGLAFRLLFFRKSIQLHWDSGDAQSLRIHGTAEYFPQLFSRELGAIKSELLSEMAEFSRPSEVSEPSMEIGEIHE